MNWDALRLSILVTTAATLLIVAAGLPLALLLARRRFRGHTHRVGQPRVHQFRG